MEYAFLLLIHHVPDEHLERLHRHIYGRVQNHKGHKSEYHSSGKRQAEASGIGQKAHYYYGNQRAEEEVRYASSQTAPCPVTERADKRLDYHAHQWRKNPEIAQVMRIRAECGEDTADIGALKRICDLYSEKSEAYVPQLPETQIGFLHCGYCRLC